MDNPNRKSQKASRLSMALNERRDAVVSGSHYVFRNQADVDVVNEQEEREMMAGASGTRVVVRQAEEDECAGQLLVPIQNQNLPRSKKIMHPDDLEALELFEIKDPISFKRLALMYGRLRHLYKRKLVENREIKEQNENLTDELQESKVALQDTQAAMRHSYRDNYGRRKEIRMFQKIFMHEDFRKFSADQINCLCLFEHITNLAPYEDRAKALWNCRYAHKSDPDYGLWAFEVEIYAWKTRTCWAGVWVNLNKPEAHTALATHAKRMADFSKTNAKELQVGGRFFSLLGI